MSFQLRPDLIIEAVNLERFDSSSAETVKDHRLLVLIEFPPQEKEFDVAAPYIFGQTTGFLCEGSERGIRRQDGGACFVLLFIGLQSHVFRYPEFANCGCLMAIVMLLYWP